MTTERALVCSIEGCERRHTARGWCSQHYQRWKRLGDPNTELQRPANRKPKSCTLDDCEDQHYGKGYCAFHWRRWKRLGDPNAPLKDFHQPLIDSNGYVRVWMPEHPNAWQKRVTEHRVVMENALGRHLVPGENIHHINGNRTDNRLENLELWVTHQPKGQRPEDLVAWAKEILERYDTTEG